MDIVKVTLLFGISFFLLSCQTTKTETAKPTSPTFSVYAGKSDPLMCNVQGDMPNCQVDWTVTSGILTHRQICNSKNRRFIKPMLSAMARTLNASCALKIKYARLTTKDDIQEEKRLAKMMSQSKLWKEFSKSKQKVSSNSKLAQFPEKFIKKVVDVKGVFSELTEALNEVGYDFVIDKVEITKLNSISDSRHFETLRQIKANKDPFIVPEDIRIVWMNRNFSLSPVIQDRQFKNRSLETQLPKKLPIKTTN